MCSSGQFWRCDTDFPVPSPCPSMLTLINGPIRYPWRSSCSGQPIATSVSCSHLTPPPPHTHNHSLTHNTVQTKSKAWVPPGLPKPTGRICKIHAGIICACVVCPGTVCNVVGAVCRMHSMSCAECTVHCAYNVVAFHQQPGPNGQS